MMMSSPNKSAAAPRCEVGQFGRFSMRRLQLERVPGGGR